MVKDAKLFQQFPLNGKVQLSTGEAPTPYHVYDGYGLFIGGTADLGAVNDLLENEDLTPVQTTDYRALVGLWLMDFTDASLAPHTEFQCSIFVQNPFFAQSQPIDPELVHPLTTLKHIVTTPNPAILCTDIWNNTAECVAYNSEHLGLGAKLADSSFSRNDDKLTFKFSADDNPIIAGTVHIPKRTSPKDGFAMLRLFGLRTVMRLARAEYTQLDVINRMSDVIPTNKAAHSYTTSRTPIVRPFTANDGITFGDIPFAHIDFSPDVIQYVEGINFVYLNP